MLWPSSQLRAPVCLVALLITQTCATETTGAPAVADRRPVVTFHEADDPDLPEFGDNDIIVILSFPSHYTTNPDLFADSASISHWYETAFIVNLALLAFRDGRILEGPKRFTDASFRVLYVNECPVGPAGAGHEECGNIYTSREILKAVTSEKYHKPKVVFGGGFSGKVVAEIAGQFAIPTIGIWQALSSLSDRSAFPWFMRVNKPESLAYQTNSQLLAELQYNQVVHWHGPGDTLTEYAVYYKELCAELGIAATIVAMEPDDLWIIPPEPGSYKYIRWTAHRRLFLDSGSHVFSGAGDTSVPFVEMYTWFHLHEMTGPGYLWLHDVSYLHWYHEALDIIGALVPWSPYVQTAQAWQGAVSFSIEFSWSSPQRTQESYELVKWAQTFRNTTGDLAPWLMEHEKRWWWDFDIQNVPLQKLEGFDAAFMTLVALNDLALQYNGQNFSPEAVLGRLIASDFQGTSGHVSFSASGQRVADTGVFQAQSVLCEPGNEHVIDTTRESRATLRQIGIFRGATKTLELDLDSFVGPMCVRRTPPAKDLDCHPGSYYVRRMGECYTCEAGEYAAFVGSTACSVCTQGTYSPAPNSSRCFACRPGEFARSNGATACEKCDEGYFQNEVQQSACREAAAGFIAPGTGSPEQLACTVGTYASERGSTACDDCPQGRSTEGAGSISSGYCVCPEGTFETHEEVETTNSSPSEPSISSLSIKLCQPCVEGMVCPFGSSLHHWSVKLDQMDALQRNGTTDLVWVDDELWAAYANIPASYPELLPGYWSSENDPLNVFSCDDATRCPGGDPGHCGPGLSKRACGHCDKTAQFWDGSECQACASDALADVLFPWVPLFGIPIATAVLYRLGKGGYEHWRIWKKSLAAFLFVMLNHLQVIGLLGEVNVELPTQTKESSSMGSWTFDWLSIFKLECANLQGIEYKIIFQVTAPMYLAASCAGLYAGSRLLSVVLRRPELKLEGARLWDVLLSVIISFFNAISAMSLSLLKCQDNPNNTASLRDDMSIVCYEDEKWKNLLGVALAGVIVYCVGSGAVFVWAIVRARSRFNNETFRKRWKSLFIRYRLDTWWWSLAYLGKNLLFNLGLVITKDGVKQIYFMITILILYALFFIVNMPYRVWHANYLEVVALVSAIVAASFTSNYTLIPKETKDSMDQTSVFISTVPIILAFLLAVRVVFYRFCRAHKGDGSTQSRDVMIQRFQKVAEAVVELDAAEINEFLLYIDEPEKHQLSVAMRVIETEVMGVSKGKRLRFRKECVREFSSRRKSSKMSGGSAASSAGKGKDILEQATTSAASTRNRSRVESNPSDSMQHNSSADKDAEKSSVFYTSGSKEPENPNRRWELET